MQAVFCFLFVFLAISQININEEKALVSLISHLVVVEPDPDIYATLYCLQE